MLGHHFRSILRDYLVIGRWWGLSQKCFLHLLQHLKASGTSFPCLCVPSCPCFGRLYSFGSFPSQVISSSSETPWLEGVEQLPVVLIVRVPEHHYRPHHYDIVRFGLLPKRSHTNGVLLSFIYKVHPPCIFDMRHVIYTNHIQH